MMKYACYIIIAVCFTLIILHICIAAVILSVCHGDKNETPEYESKIKLLLSSMWHVYLLLHFTRNNRSHTNYYYHRLLAIYPDGLPLTTRTDWEASRYDFDRQFGIVKALCENPEPAAAPTKEELDKIAELNKLCGELETVRDKLNDELTELNTFKDNVEKIKENLDSIQNSSKQIELANAIMKAIKDSQKNP